MPSAALAMLELRNHVMREPMRNRHAFLPDEFWFGLLQRHQCTESGLTSFIETGGNTP